jgi:ABC-type glycerol-3-phosphate transport system substrate-binding protein
LNKKANASIQAKSVPDMITGNPGDLFDYNTSGALVPLDDYINDPKDGLTKEQMAEITAPDLYFDKIGGKTYGISLGRSANVMYYNIDMLKAAGFDKPPETWDEFDKICAAVTKGDTYCYPFNSASGDTSAFASWVFSRGGSYAAADEKTAVFNEAAGLDSLKWLKNQADKGWGKVPTVTSRGDQADFGNGKVAFAFGTTAGLPFFQDAVNGRKDAAGNPAPFKWSVAPFPAGPKGKQVVDIFGPSLGIFKTTPERQKAAWLFIKSLLQKDQQVEWAQRLLYFPATKSAMDELLKMDDAKAKEVNPRFALVLPQYKTGASYLPLGRREPLSPAWQGVRGIIVNMLTAVFTNKTGADFKASDPEGALKEGLDRVNKALSEYGK